MSYEGLVGATSKDAPHLGGNIRGGDPFTFCPAVWDYTLQRFAVESVLDLGSGCGNASDFFFRRGRRVLSVDGLAENIENSAYPTILHDLTKGPVVAKVDLVHCQEVVEHIEERFLDNVLMSLLCGRIILMTHALPDQRGWHHVNLQHSEYWIKHLQAKGCQLLVEDTKRVRSLAERDGAPFMARSGLVFANSSRI
jgi:SAM-dependent methyltransferase